MTEAAHDVAARHGRTCPPHIPYPAVPAVRVPMKEGLAADYKVSAKSLRCISYGNTEIELTYVEQLVEIGQAKAIMDALRHLAASPKYVDGSRSLVDVIRLLEQALTSQGRPVGE